MCLKRSTSFSSSKYGNASRDKYFRTKLRLNLACSHHPGNSVSNSSQVLLPINSSTRFILKFGSVVLFGLVMEASPQVRMSASVCQTDQDFLYNCLLISNE